MVCSCMNEDKECQCEDWCQCEDCDCNECTFFASYDIEECGCDNTNCACGKGEN